MVINEEVRTIEHNDEEISLRDYIEKQYTGVFSAAAMDAHIRDYVGFTFSDSIAPLVARQIPGGRVLDIGAGFGAFVISARRLGLEAVGVEIAPFEVEYAKIRLEKEMPGLDPACVYYLGDGHTVPFDNTSFEAVTLWNVLEHVPDSERLLKEAARVLKPNGIVFIICPNYAAFRQEAHYLLPWWPLLPRKIASIYLRARGRNPRFFETNIFYRTNREVQHVLKRLGMQVARIDGPAPFNSAKIDFFTQNTKIKISQPELIRNTKIRTLMILLKRIHLNWIPVLVVNTIASLQYSMLKLKCAIYNIDLYNPFIDSVILSAKKDAR